MTHEEKLAELQNELARQDAELAQAKAPLEALGDVRIRIPDVVLREIEDACTVQASFTMNVPVCGLRA